MPSSQPKPHPSIGVLEGKKFHPAPNGTVSDMVSKEERAQEAARGPLSKLFQNIPTRANPGEVSMD